MRIGRFPDEAATAEADEDDQVEEAEVGAKVQIGSGLSGTYIYRVETEIR